jgi:hypothetical protein
MGGKDRQQRNPPYGGEAKLSLEKPRGPNRPPPGWASLNARAGISVLDIIMEKLPL